MPGSSPAPSATSTVLKRAVRRHLRHNAFLALRDHNRSLNTGAFAVIIGCLTAFKLLSLITLFVAWQGWLWDPSTWAGAEIDTTYRSPFHGHPNPFGWHWLYQGFLIAHNITGAGLFIVCLVPLFARKGDRIHVLFGRAFVVLWLFHLLDGLVNSGQLLLARGFDPTRYLDTVEPVKQGFSLYLYLQFAFIASMVIDFLAHGMAALQYKSQPPGKGMRVLMLFLPTTSLIFGLSLMGWGLLYLIGDEPGATKKTTEFAIIYLFQIPAYVYLLGKNIQYWLRPSPRTWLRDWLTEHQRNMMFCVQVTLYTGMANLTMREAPWLTPVLFISIDVGFIVWLLTKERALRRRVTRSRVGLGMLAALRSKRSNARAPWRRQVMSRQAVTASISERDKRWIMDLFDVDHSGTLDLDEIRELLHHQGVELSDAEFKDLLDMLDENGDGVIDGEEFGSFLATWVAPDPSVRDELTLAFQALDRDGDGHIDAEELATALGGGDGGLDRQELMDLMATIDKDGSGTIEWEELLAALSPPEEAWAERSLGPLSQTLSELSGRRTF